MVASGTSFEEILGLRGCLVHIGPKLSRVYKLYVSLTLVVFVQPSSSSPFVLNSGAATSHLASPVCGRNLTPHHKSLLFFLLKLEDHRDATVVVTAAGEPENVEDRRHDRTRPLPPYVCVVRRRCQAKPLCLSLLLLLRWLWFPVVDCHHFPHRKHSSISVYSWTCHVSPPSYFTLVVVLRHHKGWLSSFTAISDPWCYVRLFCWYEAARMVVWLEIRRKTLLLPLVAAGHHKFGNLSTSTGVLSARLQQWVSLLTIPMGLRHQGRPIM
ncbi:uncharacterized protein LOC122195402 [Lactuca sativa]|uniref:uncharacterized protein LOC122195402 n=1 Tax=Lactuca sativa TaxID=4236 RepID=UPI0022B07B68|nr:uncharacterized protein LOC122195402 [Lactuca sativa]